jgi:hypothetical protein
MKKSQVGQKQCPPFFLMGQQVSEKNKIYLFVVGSGKCAGEMKLGDCIGIVSVCRFAKIAKFAI